MRQVVIVGGILGGGTTLVFAAAALAATLIPTGTLVPTQGMWVGGGVRVMGVPMPGREPGLFMINEGGMAEPPFVVIDEQEWGPDGFQQRRGALDIVHPRQGTAAEGF